LNNRQEGTSLHQDYIHLDGGRTVNPQDDGLQRYEYKVNNNQISQKIWLEMTCMLNDNQKKVHQFIVQWCIEMPMTYKTRQRPKPFHLFLSGGAGVGKSHQVRTIVQTANR
jgi:hypothetical protein